MKIDFKFHPTQKVRIVAYGLNYEAIVLRCYVSMGNKIFYETEFASNGKIERGDFFEDGLTAI